MAHASSSEYASVPAVCSGGVVGWAATSSLVAPRSSAHSAFANAGKRDARTDDWRATPVAVCTNLCVESGGGGEAAAAAIDLRPRLFVDRVRALQY